MAFITKKVIEDELLERIRQIKEFVSSAEFCLDEYSYFQCAIRLEEIANIVKFDHTLMQIFEAESKEIKE